MFGIGAAVVASTGCAGMGPCSGFGDSRCNKIERKLAQTSEKIDRLNAELSARHDDIDRYHENLELTRVELARLSEWDGSNNAALPPGAAPGECFTRVYIPPAYATTTEQVLKSDAYEEVKVIPAQYEWVEERIQVKEASTRLEPVPAEYKDVQETILVRAAHDEWREGRGLIEKVDNSTGEIMCLVHVPDEFTTITKRVLVKPAGVREINVPAEYEMVKVKRLASAARTERFTTPAEYQVVSKTTKTQDGHIEWRRVLCETNVASSTISDIEVALRDAGHNPGSVDGEVDEQLMAAVEAFQQSIGLPVGGLTYETMDRLGVRVN
jgi:uncharacterized coiled-coil protein SlyX